MKVMHRLVMQDIKDERAFTIVERYAKESVCFIHIHPLQSNTNVSQSQEYHLSNP